jgi:cell division protein FtsL
MTTTLSLSQPRVLKIPFVNPKALLAPAFVVIAVLGYLGLWQNSQAAARIYQLQTLENKLENMKQENRTLQARVLQTDSLDNLENLVQKLGLEKTDNMLFLSPAETSVVTRQTP